MPFDPSTAKPVFDPSTARTAGGFDPSSARPESDVFDRAIIESQQSPLERFAGGLNYGPRETIPAETLPDPYVYRPSTAGKLALRVGVPLTVGVGTGGLGLPAALALTGAASGLGEVGAQSLEIAGNERADVSLPQVLTSTALGAVPGIPLGRVASPLLRAGIRVGEGAGLGAAYPVVESALEGRLPNASDVGYGALGGAAFGAPFGGLELLAGRTGRVIAPRTANAPEFFPQIDTGSMPNLFNEVPDAPFVPRGATPTSAQESALLFARELKEPVKSAQESAAILGNIVDAPQFPVGLRESPIVTPSELSAVSQARSDAGADIAAANMAGATTDEIQIRRLAERMAGKTPEQQLAVVKQEVALQKDVLTADQQRAALEIQQGLEAQIARQDAAEEIAAGVADQQKALADAQQAQADAAIAAAQPPELPKSAQILAENTTKPPSIANVATEVATQTKQSPYALQTRLNEMTAAPAAAVSGQPAVSAPIETAPTLNPKDASVRAAIDNPATEWLYTVQRPMVEGGKGFIQVDAINPEVAGMERNVVSSNPADLRAAGANIPDVPDWVPQGQYTLEQIKALIKQGEPKNAIQEQSPNEGVLRGEAPQPELNVELPSVVERNAIDQAVAGESALTSQVNGRGINPRPPEVTRQASRMRQTRGAVSPQILAPLAGGAGGAAFGATQGDTPEERVRNAAIYGALGLGLGGAVGVAAKRLSQPPVRNYQSPVLKDVAQMLTPKEESVPLLKRVADGYNNFRYRFNTRYAPIGQAQRSLFKRANRPFVPDSYYDLERGFERVAGAPVQAEGEVELLQNVLDKLPGKNVQDFDTYLTLSRIEDRLVKTSEANDVLMDAVGRAQAEVDAAAAAVKANPNQKGFASLAARREELASATRKLNEEFNRKRVGDWTIAKARQGLAELEQHVGPQAFAALQEAGQEFQDVMQRSLQIQVDAGRLDPQLRDDILASNDFYAPFKVLKYFDEEAPFVKGGGTNRIPSQEQLAKKITGIDDTDVRIGSPTSVAAEQVYKGYILAQKNLKMRQLATLARLDPTGEYVKPLGPDMEPRKGYEAVSYLQNGQSKRLEVARPIAEALNGINANQQDVILNALGRFAGVFKLGATGMSIPFNIANAAVFDPLRLATISKYGFRGPQDFLYTLYEWPRALWSSARGNVGQYLGASPDALYEQWIKSGAANSTLARVMNPEAFTARLPKNAKLGDLVAENNFGTGTPLKVASLLSNTLEETTKLLGLQRAMRIEGLDKLPPAQRERKWDEIVTELRNYAGSPDFARSGVDMRALNIVMPFTNPRWQGFLADFSRLNPFRQGNAKDAGAAWARLGTLVATPAAGLAWWNLHTPENEKDYYQIPQQERERYFHIPLYADKDGKPTLVDYGRGGYYFKNKDGVDIRGYRRIPKREFPGLMANTIEDFVGFAKANDPQSFGQLAANFTDNFANTASPISIQGDTAEERFMSAAAGINPAIRVPVEVGTNRNFFTGRDIVPESRIKASPELQFTESTPDFYKRAAESMPDFAPETLRSPAKLQHITEGMTGGFVRQFATPRLSPGNPAGETSPLLGRFYRSERVENEALTKGAEAAERGRADQRITEQDIASKLAALIEQRTTPEAKQKVITDAKAAGLLNPETFKYLKEELQDAQRGLTYEDRVVKRSYSIAGGYRAQYFLDKVASLPVGQRNAYLQDQRDKGLLTKDVANQMRATLATGGQ